MPLYQIADSTADCLPEFLLQTLQDVVDQEGPSYDKHDVLVALLYVLMLETGFIPKDSVEALEDHCYAYCYKRMSVFASLPKGWKAKNKGATYYRLSFVLNGFPQNVCRFVCIPTPDDLIVNVEVAEFPQLSISMFLHPSKYILNSSVNLLANSLPRLQNLRHLSIMFKDEVCNRVKLEILKGCDVNLPFLELLPPEIILQIIGLLDFRSVLSFGVCNKQFEAVAKEPGIWKNLLMADFRVRETSNDYRTLRRVYFHENTKRNSFQPDFRPFLSSRSTAT